MPSRQQARVVEQLYDAAKTPGLWSAALQRIADMVGGIGAGYVVQNRRTGAVEWVTVTGPCAELEPRYIDFYAPRDLYVPLLSAAPLGRWMPLSRCVSKREASR